MIAPPVLGAIVGFGWVAAVYGILRILDRVTRQPPPGRGLRVVRDDCPPDCECWYCAHGVRKP